MYQTREGQCLMTSNADWQTWNASRRYDDIWRVSRDTDGFMQMIVVYIYCILGRYFSSYDEPPNPASQSPIPKTQYGLCNDSQSNEAIHADRLCFESRKSSVVIEIWQWRAIRNWSPGCITWPLCITLWNLLPFDSPIPSRPPILITWVDPLVRRIPSIEKTDAVRY